MIWCTLQHADAEQSRLGCENSGITWSTRVFRRGVGHGSSLLTPRSSTPEASSSTYANNSFSTQMSFTCNIDRSTVKEIERWNIKCIQLLRPQKTPAEMKTSIFGANRQGQEFRLLANARHGTPSSPLLVETWEIDKDSNVSGDDWPNQCCPAHSFHAHSSGTGKGPTGLLQAWIATANFGHGAPFSTCPKCWIRVEASLMASGGRPALPRPEHWPSSSRFVLRLPCFVSFSFSFSQPRIQRP